MNKNSKFIMISSFILAISISLIDLIFKPDYALKSIIKAIFFIPIPLFYFLSNNNEKQALKSFLHSDKKYFFKSLFLALFVYVFIVIGYFFTKNYIDYSNITIKLTENMGITKNNFIFVSLYIAFVNSFLEEFFFRGFSFLALKKHISKKVAYIFSSFIFAIYHSGMTTGWFNPFILFLTLIGLFIAGLIFAWLNEKSENIYPSWFVHMFANFGINTVGFILFNIN